MMGSLSAIVNFGQYKNFITTSVEKAGEAG